MSRFESIESVTKLEIKDDAGVVITVCRVWRAEKDIGGCFEVTNQDLYDAVADVLPEFRGEIAHKLAKMPRVRMVEVLKHPDGYGVVIAV